MGRAPVFAWDLVGGLSVAKIPGDNSRMLGAGEAIAIAQ
jgi:hypothetical protein